MAIYFALAENASPLPLVKFVIKNGCHHGLNFRLPHLVLKK